MEPDPPGSPPEQARNDPGWGNFCEIFVNTDLSTDGLGRLIAELLDAAVEWHGFATTIIGSGYVLDIHRNERRFAIANQQTQQTRDFVEWPYYLEIDAQAKQTRQAQIAVIARLLIGLWDRGLGAVAVCDFEDELPQRGGYNPALPEASGEEDE